MRPIVLSAVMAFVTACATAPTRPQMAPVAPPPTVAAPELAADLPAGWTRSRHPGLYKDGETVIYVHEAAITQLSLWLLPPDGRSPQAIADERVSGALPDLLVGRAGTWNGLRWAAYRARMEEEAGVGALFVARELRGTPYLVVAIGIWPKWVPAMEAEVNAVIARLHVEGSAAEGDTFEWVPVQ